MRKTISWTGVVALVLLIATLAMPGGAAKFLSSSSYFGWNISIKATEKTYIGTLVTDIDEGEGSAPLWGVESQEGFDYSDASQREEYTLANFDNATIVVSNNTGDYQKIVFDVSMCLAWFTQLFGIVSYRPKDFNPPVTLTATKTDADGHTTTETVNGTIHGLYNANGSASDVYIRLMDAEVKFTANSGTRYNPTYNAEGYITGDNSGSSGSRQYYKYGMYMDPVVMGGITDASSAFILAPGETVEYSIAIDYDGNTACFASVVAHTEVWTAG